MQPMPTGTAAGGRDMEAGAYRYLRHQPENNRLYRIIERHYPEFTAYLAEQGATAGRLVQLRCASQSFKVIQNIYSCDPDRSGRLRLGQLAGIWLQKLKFWIGERGFYSDEGGIGKEFVIEAG
jgi:hypothetical protein